MLLSTTDGAATAATSAAALSQKPRLYKTVSLNEITCIKLITTEPRQDAAKVHVCFRVMRSVHGDRRNDCIHPRAAANQRNQLAQSVSRE
jgi:hypothetical protein